MEAAEPLPLPESLAGVSAKTQVADIVNAVRCARRRAGLNRASRLSEHAPLRAAPQVLDNTSASLDAYHRCAPVRAARAGAGREGRRVRAAR